jgi:hypothetical protein
MKSKMKILKTTTMTRMSLNRSDFELIMRIAMTMTRDQQIITHRCQRRGKIRRQILQMALLEVLKITMADQRHEREDKEVDGEVATGDKL